MEALRRDLPSLVIREDVEFVALQDGSEPRNLALDDVLPDTAVQISACPFDLDVNHTFQQLIDTLYNNRKLSHSQGKNHL
jgi:hypothetical protein